MTQEEKEQYESENGPVPVGLHSGTSTTVEAGDDSMDDEDESFTYDREVSDLDQEREVPEETDLNKDVVVEGEVQPVESAPVGNDENEKNSNYSGLGLDKYI